MGIWTHRIVMLACVIVAIAVPSIASSGPLRSDWHHLATGGNHVMSDIADPSREAVRAQNSDDPERTQNRSVRNESDDGRVPWLPDGPSLAEQRKEGAADTEGAFASYSPRSIPSLAIPWASGSSTSTNVAWRDGSISDVQTNQKNRPVWIAAGGISLDARVIEVGIDRRSGEMEIPTAGNTTGWYRHGPAPGEPGTTVIAGHFDDDAGLSVFGRLSRLKPGDAVEVVLLDGSKVRYDVRETVRFRADEIPGDELFRRDGPSTLALVTCTGRFNWSTMRYEETLVVYADPT